MRKPLKEREKESLKDSEKTNNICINCKAINECAWNDWKLFDSENPNCPNNKQNRSN